MTSRRLEVLQLTADGKTAEDIAAILHVTSRTVNFHLQEAFKEFDVYNKAHAVAEGFRRGLLK